MDIILRTFKWDISSLYLVQGNRKIPGVPNNLVPATLSFTSSLQEHFSKPFRAMFY